MKNLEIIRKVNAGFEAGDTDAILSHLTDDIRWHINGNLAATNKEEFRKEVKNEAFEGTPVITVKNELEDGDLAAVEGEVKARFKGGAKFEGLFFDIYMLTDGKIKEMRSYVIEKKVNG